MSEQPASARRVAVVGASTPSGTALREALARFGLPGAQVNLYGSAGGEAVISEYDGEARLIQGPELAEIVAHDVVYLCESGTLARDVARAVGPDTLVIDVVGGLGKNANLADPDLEPSAARDLGGVLAVAHPLAAIFAELLRELDRRFGVERIEAVILRPAADYGEAGLEELREQTVRLLNFTELPTSVFGRQLAFNILADDSGEEQKIVQDLEGLLGWPDRRLTLRLVTVPVFHGHCFQVHLRLRADSSLEEVGAVLGQARMLQPPGADQPATPLDVATETRIGLSRLSEDGLGGYWLWAVAGEATAAGADRAVRLAVKLGGF